MDKKLFHTISAAMLLCVLCCLPLWVNDRLYPVVPVVEGVVFSGFAQWILLALWAVSFLFFWVSAQKRGSGILIFILISILLALQDQLRWQPWYYQYLVMLLLYSMYEFRLISERALLNAFRIIIACIYFWSGVHKINAGFVEDIFPGLLGFDIGLWGYGAAVLEALMAIGLMFRKTRNIAVLGIWGMHVLIVFHVVISGSLLYDLVILPWNISMMIMLYLLFWRRDFNIVRTEEGLVTRIITLFFFLVLPALNFWGLWPDFQSFTLFSGKEKKAFLYVNEEFKNTFTSVPDSLYDYQNRVFVQKISYPEIRVPTNSEFNVYKSLFKSFCERSENNLDIILEIKYLPNILVNERVSETYFCDDVTG